VSGSGKSTLMHDVLYPALARHFGKATETPGAHDRLLGADWLGDAVFVDQSPIGKTARSNPASYVGAFDEIRKLFAQAPLAKERGYTASMFSFNAGDGRCPTCGGSGFEHVEMQFLSDVYLRCPDCDGRRYRAELLDVKLDRRLPGDVTRDLSVADVLELTVNEGRTEPYDLGDGYNHIAITVEDIDAVVARLGEAGHQPERPPYHPGGNEAMPRICFFADPDGYRVELIDQRFDTPQDPDR
jgi:excinuclease UvrABC ATPase subunit